jgi:NAD(P)-dependent dehydrogenase (short-subunit alcohol dehydrogenase family)
MEYAAETTGASSSAESKSEKDAKTTKTTSDDENTAAVALREYFQSKGVSPEDIQTTINVLNAVSDLSHKDSSHKRKHVGSVTNSIKKKRKNNESTAAADCMEENKDENEPNDEKNNGNNDTKNSRSTTEAAKHAADELLNEYRTSKGLRHLRKAFIQCYNKVIKPAMFDGHSSLDNFRNQKESLTQMKKRKMAESNQQRKHIANTMLRKGRIDKLNAKLQEGQEEERSKFERLKLTAMMVPDGHVDTGPTPTALPQLTNGTDATNNNNEAPTVTTVDDETQPQTVLPKLRSCYVCKGRFRILHEFYDQLCPDCAALNWANRHKTRDLRGKVAVVTGSRVKIGYQTCLKLLRAGCHVIATTRFPNSAVDSYKNEPDFDQWKDNLEIYGLDLRDVTGLELFCRYLNHKLGGESSSDEGGQQTVGLDILINNACQTIRRPAAYYLPACKKEKELWSDADETHKGLLKGCMEYERLRRRLHLSSGAASSPASGSLRAAPAAIGNSSMIVPRLERNPVSSATSGTVSDDPAGSGNTPAMDTSTSLTTAPSTSTATPFETTGMSHSAASSQMILCPEDVGLDDSVLPEGLSDINGQQLDLRKTNSWLLKMDQVSTPELMECMFVNAIAPFVLNSRLQPLLAKRRKGETTNRFVVNVSAMEGKFYRYKMANHPHTNMAKSALNMMTRTAAEDLAKNHGVYMNSIDTGWINDENPLERAAKTAKVNDFQTPIDEIDAASRLVEPIFSDSKVYGKFLKDYRETEW